MPIHAPRIRRSLFGPWSGAEVVEVLIVALLVGNLLLLAFVLHKVRRVHLMQFESQRVEETRLDNLYAQFEALLALQRDLDLPAPLPPTRGWAGSPDFLCQLRRLAVEHRPLNIVECSSGTSTVVLARTVQQNRCGHVTSLEHDPVYAKKTRAELERQGLAAFATVIDAPLIEHLCGDEQVLWYDTRGVRDGIDMLVIDGPPWNTRRMARQPAVPLLSGKLAREALIILDDADRPDERAAVQSWKRGFGLQDFAHVRAEKGIAVLRHEGSLVVS